jgi:hypothetical protein
MSQARLTELVEPVYVAPSDQETTNDYADVTGSKIDTFSKKLVSYTCTNTDGANAIKWKVLASNDDVTYVEAQAEAALAAAAVGTYTATAAPYRYYKVQVKASVGGAQGDARVRGMSKF